MSAVPKLLVVDDEPVVCMSCSRIFEGRGYGVETSTSSDEGLAMATTRDYDAILLDVRMPEMDGLEFLRELRQRERQTPVVIITGYSSVPNAVEAMRLGAVDYVSKPFTPDEIARVVGRIAPAERPAAPAPATAPQPAAQPAVLESVVYRYVDEAWFRVDADGTARVGAVVASEDALRMEELVLPRVGDELHRGLPLAALVLPGSERRIVPSPIGGTVVEVNEALRGRPGRLTDDPCVGSWFVRVQPRRLAEDVAAGHVREVIVAAGDGARARSLSDRLSRLGCTVCSVGTAEAALEAAWNGNAALALVDARSLGSAGPALVQRLADELPDLRIAALDVPTPELERDYLTAGVMYHSVEPVQADELLDIVVSAYRPPAPLVEPAPQAGMLPPELRAVRIVNRYGHKVSLLAAPGVLREREGVGRRTLDALAVQGHPLHVALGRRELGKAVVRQEAAEHDRVVLLEALDRGRLPGSVERQPGADVPGLTAAELQKLVTVSVQPTSPDGALDVDPRTAAALADLLAHELSNA
jgi:CheY-like chemotaxis protein